MSLVNVFLVDDDPDDRMLFQLALGESGIRCAVRTAVNGVDALQQLMQDRAEAQDVIFIDINMPRMDGRELLPRIKQLSKYRSTPVIVYSTSTSEMDIAMMKAAGAYKYMVKQTSYDALCAELTRVLEELHLAQC